MNLGGELMFWLLPDVQLRFGSPKLLWLTILVPVLVVAYAIDGQRRSRVLERIGHHPMIAQMIDSLSPGRRRLQSVFSVLGIAALALVVSRPQVPGRARLSESRGLDLVVALDLSRSMLARDVYPSRLERAKAEISRLLDEMKGDRVGLVAFAGETLAYPLTTDYEAAKLFWRDLQPSDMPVGGTDLGRAITVATELLDRSAARIGEGRRKPGQVMILITDGEDTEARALDAAKIAAAHGIRIYTIAIGSKDRPFVPITDEDGKPTGYLNGNDGEPLRVGVDEVGLKKIAALSSGEYFTIEPRGFGVERVQQAIQGLERTEEEARLEREPEDIGRWFAIAAFALLALGAAIGERKRKLGPRLGVAPVDEAVASPTRAPRRQSLPASPVLVLFLLFPLLGGFDLFLRADPDVEAGNRAMAAGKAAEALQAYDRAAAARPDDPTVRFDRGAALLKLDKLPEATREFQRAAEARDPSLKSDAYYNLGVAQFKQERFREAVDAYKRSLALRPDDRRTKWNLELAQRRLKEQKEKPPQDDKQKSDQQQDQQKQDQQKQDQQKSDQQKQDDAQKQDQQKQDQQKQAEAQKQDAQRPEAKKNDAKKGDEKPATVEKASDLERQDAEAVLDALERSEPTVQKDLAKRRAGGRKPKKDW